MEGRGMRGVSKDMKKLFRQVRNHGWSVRQRRNNHYVMESPDGEKVFCGGTPSDHRAIKNIERDLANAGLDLRR